MRRMTCLIAFLGVMIPLSLTAQTPAFSADANVMSAKGVLRVHPANSRYFTDGTKMPDGSLRAVYLTGSHTWGNLCDYRERWPAFDFTGYLDFLERNHHNFLRLWSGDGLGHQPVPYARTGPGTANDGGLKVDIDRFDPAFFDRLRSRVVAARDRGIYVGIMLFRPDSGAKREDWNDLLYHPANNMQGIDADTNGDGSGAEAYDLSIPRITAWQEAFVRKVVDTVNDLDNVLYEISNEGEDSSRQWQYHLIRFIHDYEAPKPKQHPAGMTAIGSGDAESNVVLFASPAEWISPHTFAWGGVGDIPIADGVKVSLLDSDHWFVKEIYNHPAFGRDWVWKAFCRGHNPILMEHLSPLSFVDHDYPLTGNDPGYIASRKAMGQTRRLANRMNLAAMTPRGDLAGSGYCLANPGKEYLVYLPQGGEVTVDLSAASGMPAVEWLDPRSGDTTQGPNTPGGEKRPFQPPFPGDAVLYLRSVGPQNAASTGRASASPVLALAARGVEVHRKGDATIRFVRKDGTDASGVKIEVAQRTHDFAFGLVRELALFRTIASS